MSFNPHVERSDRLYQSADLAIRDLLGGGADPLAKAAYLWVVRRNDKLMVNSDALAVWGIGWVRQVLVDGETSRRRDEDVASAALVAAALSETREFAALKDKAAAALRAALAEALKRGAIPFRRPPYAATLLYGAYSLGVDATGMWATVTRTAEAFRDAIPGGRLFGLPFTVRMLRDLKEEKLSRELDEAIKVALSDPKTNYEDQAVLVQALWEAAEGEPDESMMAATERLLSRSPAWGYLMNGVEDVPPADDGEAAVFLSHLYGRRCWT